MRKIPEPEDLQMLRHRWARAIEIWVAYQTFLHREVLVGPDKICIDNLVVSQTTHTLLVAYYSFIYSLFDPSATHFERVTEKLMDSLPEEAKGVRKMILEHWKTIQEPISIIRSNIGFHGSPKSKGLKYGYGSFKSIHPWASEYLMTLMRVFFRFVHEVFESKEPMAIPPKRLDTLEILRMAKEMKAYIDANPTEAIMEQWSDFFGRVSRGEIRLLAQNSDTRH